jgi:hypothetical protein
MRSGHSIIVFGVVVIGIVLLTAHPGRGAAGCMVIQWLGRARGWLPVASHFTWNRFWCGVVAAAFAFVALNALPHFLTRQEPEHCGLQVAGFPFTFRAFGGYAGSVSFHTPTLILDALLGLVAAAAIGYSVARLRRRQIQSR